MNTYLERLRYYQPEISKAFLETGNMLFFATLAAVVIGLPLGTLIFLTRKNGVMENKFFSFFFNGYVNVIRSFPFLLFVVALIPFTRFVLGTSFGTAAASFPLAFIAVAIYARLVEQTLLEVPDEVIELAYSLGASKKQLVFHFLYGEARSGLVLSLTSVIISMVSYSTIMGVVGGGGIGDFAIRYGYQRYESDVMYTMIVFMILLVMLVQLCGTLIARKMDKRKK